MPQTGIGPVDVFVGVFEFADSFNTGRKAERTEKEINAIIRGQLTTPTAISEFDKGVRLTEAARAFISEEGLDPVAARIAAIGLLGIFTKADIDPTDPESERTLAQIAAGTVFPPTPTGPIPNPMPTPNLPAPVPPAPAPTPNLPAPIPPPPPAPIDGRPGAAAARAFLRRLGILGIFIPDELGTLEDEEFFEANKKAIEEARRAEEKAELAKKVKIPDPFPEIAPRPLLKLLETVAKRRPVATPAPKPKTGIARAPQRQRQPLPFPAPVRRPLITRSQLLGILATQLLKDDKPNVTNVTQIVNPLATPVPSPTPTPSPVPPTVSPDPLTPTFTPTAPLPTQTRLSPTSSRTKECQEVTRRRRRKGVCREGFFEELPGKTRFTTWRVVDCRTRKKIPTR